MERGKRKFHEGNKIRKINKQFRIKPRFKKQQRTSKQN
jgi:hypothetical protein